MKNVSLIFKNKIVRLSLIIYIFLFFILNINPALAQALPGEENFNIPSSTPESADTSLFTPVNNSRQTNMQNWQPVKRSIGQYEFPGLKKQISVDFRGIELVDAIKYLATEADLDVITSQGINGTITLFIDKVAIRDAFDMIMSLNNLAFMVEGTLIKVMPNEMYEARQGIDFYDPRKTVIHQLKYASSAKLGGMLADVKSRIGKIIFDDSTGMLVLIDTPRKIKEMEEIVEKVEIPTVIREYPTETKVFELEYAAVEDIEGKISELLTPEIGFVKSDTRTNIIVVTDFPNKIDRIEKIINAFDRKSREVFIEAKIVQVSLSNAFKWGVDWSKLIKNFVGNEDLTITPEVSLPLGLTNYGKITLAQTGSSNLNAVLEALSTIGETKIISNPHIATEDGKEATLNVITKQPYSQTTTTTTDAATTEALEFTFVDVGVKLNVTPRINKNGFISMKIKPEVSSITSFFPDSTSEQRVPVVETSNAESTVLIKDGTTIIIAGMIKDSKTTSENKVPLFGDIPVFGGLFRNKSDEIQRTETIVFLTPHIITGDESYILQREKSKPKKGLRRRNEFQQKEIISN